MAVCRRASCWRGSPAGSAPSWSSTTASVFRTTLARMPRVRFRSPMMHRRCRASARSGPPSACRRASSDVARLAPTPERRRVHQNAPWPDAVWRPGAAASALPLLTWEVLERIFESKPQPDVLFSIGSIRARVCWDRACEGAPLTAFAARAVVIERAWPWRTRRCRRPRTRPRDSRLALLETRRDGVSCRAMSRVRTHHVRQRSHAARVEHELVFVAPTRPAAQVHLQNGHVTCVNQRRSPALPDTHDTRF
jgi:hypothetical protein